MDCLRCLETCTDGKDGGFEPASHTGSPGRSDSHGAVVIGVPDGMPVIVTNMVRFSSCFSGPRCSTA